MFLHEFSSEHVMLMKNSEIQTEIESLLLRCDEYGTNTDVISLSNYLRESNFYKDPASKGYHLSVEGGLARHTLSVYRETARLLDSQPSWVTEGLAAADVILAGLCHDLCKVGTYELKDAWRKDAQDKWEKYMRYENVDLIFNPGHGVGSLLILQEFGKTSNTLSEAILHHMGSYDGGSYTASDKARQASYGSNPLAVALHLGDMTSAWMLERKVTDEFLKQIEAE